MLTVQSIRCDASFPSFLPKQVNDIKDLSARKLAARIQRLPVSFGEQCVMSSCVKPLVIKERTSPVVLLHGFDSSCLEWRYAYPLLEEAGLEAWAVDVLGWGFNDLERRPSCSVAAKREHLFQLWKSYIRKPMVLVGPSLGAAVAIDFATSYPEAVERLILIDASVYTEGSENQPTLSKMLAYVGAFILKSFPLRFYVNFLCFFTDLPLSTKVDYTNIGCLHCRFPWWEDALVDFMMNGVYNVSSQIAQVKQRTLIIWGEEDRIISNKLGVRLHSELPNAIIRQIPDCGHIPHVEKPSSVAKLIVEFLQESQCKEVEYAAEL